MINELNNYIYYKGNLKNLKNGKNPKKKIILKLFTNAN